MHGFFSCLFIISATPGPGPSCLHASVLVKNEIIIIMHVYVHVVLIMSECWMTYYVVACTCKSTALCVLTSHTYTQTCTSHNVHCINQHLNFPKEQEIYCIEALQLIWIIKSRHNNLYVLWRVLELMDVQNVMCMQSRTDVGMSNSTLKYKFSNNCFIVTGRYS